MLIRHQSSAVALPGAWASSHQTIQLFLYARSTVAAPPIAIWLDEIDYRRGLTRLEAGYQETGSAWSRPS